ncbi:MAG: hypothetical protein AB199_02470 [Parcubacteria bacterium C7867-004]|nr:MAG: hypothetical protein AB199_02470 [Parcubacteria bacterium C7867-004]
MQYFFDFDRTVFDTEAFKKAFKKRPPFRDLLRQFRHVIVEAFDPSSTLSKRRIAARTLGTYVSHRRFGFMPQELKEYLYPDAVAFFTEHGKDCTIVTYGVRAFITAKVANALTDFPLKDIVYTHQKKGRTIRRLTAGIEDPCIFVDDAVFQLVSVRRACPTVSVIEIRRDGRPGDGRFPVIASFDELHSIIASK